MLPEELNYPAAYCDGHACLYERATKYSTSYFGGPTEIQIAGLRHGPRPIHHLMTLNWQAIPGIEKKGVTVLPLFYGMGYSGCSMTYEIVGLSRCKLLEMEPSTLQDYEWR